MIRWPATVWRKSWKRTRRPGRIEPRVDSRPAKHALGNVVVEVWLTICTGVNRAALLLLRIPFSRGRAPKGHVDMHHVSMTLCVSCFR